MPERQTLKEVKFCGACKVSKSKSYFYNAKLTKDGKQTVCKACSKANNRKAYRKNKKRLNYYYKHYRKKRYHNDIAFNIKCKLRSRMCLALKTTKKSFCTMKLTGCSANTLQHHIESHFQGCMSWGAISRIHIDHHVPISAFDMTKVLDQRVCFWYKNLRPLWAGENLHKHSKYREIDKKRLLNDYIFYHI
jgi:hypothetical protein